MFAISAYGYSLPTYYFNIPVKNITVFKWADEAFIIL